jgi:hypothetical protein
MQENKNDIFLTMMSTAENSIVDTLSAVENPEFISFSEYADGIKSGIEPTDLGSFIERSGGLKKKLLFGTSSPLLSEPNLYRDFYTFWNSLSVGLDLSYSYLPFQVVSTFEKTSVWTELSQSLVDWKVRMLDLKGKDSDFVDSLSKRRIYKYSIESAGCRGPFLSLSLLSYKMENGWTLVFEVSLENEGVHVFGKDGDIVIFLEKLWEVYLNPILDLLIMIYKINRLMTLS